MKKIILLFTLVAFLGVTVAPVYAVTVDDQVVLLDKDDKPKKDKKAAKTATKKADAKSDKGCADAKSTECCGSKAKASCDDKKTGDKKAPEKK